MIKITTLKDVNFSNSTNMKIIQNYSKELIYHNHLMEKKKKNFTVVISIHAKK